MRHAGVAALGMQLLENALKRLGLRDSCFLIAECSEQEAAALIPIIQAVLTTLREKDAVKIE